MRWQNADAWRKEQLGLQFWRELSDRRGTASVVDRKCFAGCRMSRLRVVPTDKFRNYNRGGIGRCKRGQMQRLANVAGSVTTAVFMFVEERSARGKVEKRDTGQQGQRAPRGYFIENVLHESHATFSLHSNVPN